MPLWKQSQFSRLQNQQPADGGEGGGGASTITPEVQAQIDAAVNAAIGGLKSKNSELLGKLKDAGTNLQRFDGIDPDAVRNILKRFTDDEEAGLIAKGEIDTVLNKRTERMKADFDKQLKSRDDVISQAHAKATKLAAGKVSGALTQAASKTGALPEAMEDIVLRGQGQGWTVNDDGDVVAMRDGEIVLGKDGKTALNPIEWAESLRETAPHLWPKAQGTGAPGASGGKPSAAKGDLGGNKNDRVAALAARFPELRNQ